MNNSAAETPSSGVVLRPARPTDSAQVLAWANDPITRAASFDSKSIDEAAHAQWFASALRDPTRALFVARQGHQAAAFLRIERKSDGQAMISINVAPEARGCGVGRAVLNAAREEAKKLGYDTLVAHIRPSNTGSIRAFAAVGYREVGREIVRGQAALRFELRV